MPPRKSNSMENINIHLRGFKANHSALSPPSPSSPANPPAFSFSHCSSTLHWPLPPSSSSSSFPDFSSLFYPALTHWSSLSRTTDDLYRQNNNLISPQLGTIQNCTTKIINKFCAGRWCRFQPATAPTPSPPPPSYTPSRPPPFTHTCAHRSQSIFIHALFFYCQKYP